MRRIAHRTQPGGENQYVVPGMGRRVGVHHGSGDILDGALPALWRAQRENTGVGSALREPTRSSLPMELPVMVTDELRRALQLPRHLQIQLRRRGVEDGRRHAAELHRRPVQVQAEQAHQGARRQSPLLKRGGVDQPRLLDLRPVDGTGGTRKVEIEFPDPPLPR